MTDNKPKPPPPPPPPPPKRILKEDVQVPSKPKPPKNK